MPRPLTQELHNAWLRALQRWWTTYNREYLHQALQPPIIELGSGRQRLGAWDGRRRRLIISTDHIAQDCWGAVLDTLRHEMAHQFVDEVLRPSGEGPHGPAFARACRYLRCEPRARSKWRPAAGGAGEDRVIRRVRKLLSLAESPNQNEAQAAVRKARRLLLEYNIELVRGEGKRHFERRQLGRVKGRHSAWELWVAMLLSDFFFVEVLWAHSYDAAQDLSGTVLEIYATPTNLEMAEYVYDYLEGLLPRLWDRYRGERNLPGNRERMRYWAGVVQGLHEKLATEAGRVPGEGAAAPGSTALVWRGDHQLQAYFRYHNPRIVTRRTGGVAATDAFHHGVAEGHRVTIHPPVEGAAGFGGYLR